MAAVEPAVGTVLAAVKALLDRAPELGVKKLAALVKSEYGLLQCGAKEVRKAKEMLARDPMLLTDMKRDMLLCVLTSKESLASRDLASLACAAKTFAPELIDEAAEAIVSAYPRSERCPRREAFQEDHRADGSPGQKREGECWLDIYQQIEQLSKPLAFTFTAGKKKAGEEGPFKSTGMDSGSMVCSDFPMRAGIHHADFTINEHTTWGTIGVVRSQLTTYQCDQERSVGFHGPVGDPAEYLRYRDTQASEYEVRTRQYELPEPGEDSPELLLADTIHSVWMSFSEDGWGWSSDDAQPEHQSQAGKLLHGSMCCDGNTRYFGDEWSGQQSWDKGDVLGLRLDVEKGLLTAYKNGERLGQMMQEIPESSILLKGAEWGESEAFYFCAEVGPQDSFDSVSIAWAEPSTAEQETAAFDAHELDRHTKGLCGQAEAYRCKHCVRKSEEYHAMMDAEAAAGLPSRENARKDYEENFRFK